MKLHTFVGSPHSRKVQAVISHIGLQVDTEYHDLLAGELGLPEYVALNANAMVPLLIDGEFRLTESNAIMQYLADKASDGSLFPQDPQRRADVVRWQFWELAHFNKALGILAFEIVAKPKFNLGPTNSALVDTMRADLARFAPVLERHLADRHYMVGEGITLADYAVIAFEAYRSRVPFDWSPFRNINAYFDRLRLVEHWRRTAAEDPDLLGRKPKAA
ncbi:MAG TPA: glutathione S-transferase family protein [Stellaceae bacterium]|nr:glutathione S-transferase family protein [Stellaceae bacterium]